jgi:hypothetical protein
MRRPPFDSYLFAMTTPSKQLEIKPLAGAALEISG